MRSAHMQDAASRSRETGTAGPIALKFGTIFSSAKACYRSNLPKKMLKFKKRYNDTTTLMY